MWFIKEIFFFSFFLPFILSFIYLNAYLFPLLWFTVGIDTFKRGSQKAYVSGVDSG